jgi:catalase
VATQHAGSQPPSTEDTSGTTDRSTGQGATTTTRDGSGNRSAPAPVGPTGARDGARSQTGDALTTAQGLPLPDTDHSLKAGPRGPTLLQDHHFREKVTHFDHERIPERVVHARGAGAHGVFEANGEAAPFCRAAFLAAGASTPTFTRFSTVLGSRGSADTVRDTRGFATKFFTAEGVFDLVGNNIPVFFIQDAIKFPDIVHAAKPHPDVEIPQAQSAHDTFWDFVSLHTQAQAHTMWNMSDRGIPRSYRMMEGFGVHTFRLANAEGGTCLVKFHWKPRAGVHSLVWEEAQMIAGMDPDFHRRDLADAIDRGAFPQYDLGLQVMPDDGTHTFEGIDLLDPTKFVPEELAPVVLVGTLTLTGNPTNYFAQTEQVAFHPGHLVPGIDVTDDPLLQGRLFSYLDTQLSRLGGPNFMQLPINRPHAAVNDMLRDGMHQTAVHEGIAPYHPNSLDGGCPVQVPGAQGGYVEFPQPMAPGAVKERAEPVSFSDHVSQAALFYRSLTPVEQEHLVEAYTFELGKCREQAIRLRQLQVLADIDAQLCALVAAGLGMTPPDPTAEPPAIAMPSPAVSQVGRRWPVVGRQVGIIVGADADAEPVDGLADAVAQAGMVPLVVAPTGAAFGGGRREARAPDRTYLTARSVEFDALILAAGAGAPDARVLLAVAEAYRHCKPIGVVGDAPQLLGLGGLDPTVAGEPAAVVAGIADALAGHRVWERQQPIGEPR